MIRPFTLICMASALGAGLYLYQSKHQAQLLDRDIGRTIKLTESTRERTGMLRAEWALLNEPDRLAELAKAHTALQTLKPTQFVALNDLAARLPAPSANNRERLPAEAEPEEVPAAPVAQAAPPAPPIASPAPAPAPATAKPHEVAVAAEPKPKPEAKPTVVAEAKPVVRHVEKPIVAAPAAPMAVAAEPVRARQPHPQTEIASNDATAPGTVGAAVLRAMRAQNAGTAYAQPALVQPSYAPPAAAPPTYAAPAYAAPASSLLGGRALPPPVPFAAR